MVVFAMEESNFITNNLQSNLTNSKSTNEQNAEPSILCKYRSLGACKCTLMDIFENKRLFMSSHKAQNDFAEGDYYFCDNGKINTSKILDTIGKAKSQYKICSLAIDDDKINRLMWGHYANGGNGIMIRLRLPDEVKSNSNFCCKSISYKKKLKLSERKLECPNDEVIRKILLNKHTSWKYENEYRVLAKFDSDPGCSYCPIEIKEVVVGPEAKTKDNGLLKKLKEKYGGCIEFKSFEETYHC